MSVTIRAWYLQDEKENSNDVLGCLLRQWANRPENSCWSIDGLRWKPDMTALVRSHRPDILIAVDPPCLTGSWLSEVLSEGVGLVASLPAERTAALLPLAENYTVQLAPWPVRIEELGLALLNVWAALCRQRSWQARIHQLQQRLSDRIVIERAKGILVERLGISEREAYRRMRVQSRRQRRPMRDIAQGLLDAQSLLCSEWNSLGEASNPLLQSFVDRPSEKM